MTKMMFAGAAMALALAAGAAHAQNYDGYCYAKKADAKTTGTIVGAVIGGALGSQISKNERASARSAGR
ncbi:MAG: glycine zipper 2TM domain-containing protein [Asticcacaulis sp.]